MINKPLPPSCPLPLSATDPLQKTVVRPQTGPLIGPLGHPFHIPKFLHCHLFLSPSMVPHPVNHSIIHLWTTDQHTIHLRKFLLSVLFWASHAHPVQGNCPPSEALSLH